MKYVSFKWLNDCNNAASLTSYESPAPGSSAPRYVPPVYKTSPTNKKNELKKSTKTAKRFGLLGEGKAKVKIKVKPGALGLELDDPLSMYKGQITGGKPWEKLSKQLTTLYIYNKNKHPDVASQAMGKRDALARWVDTKRVTNPEFGK